MFTWIDRKNDVQNNFERSIYIPQSFRDLTSAARGKKVLAKMWPINHRWDMDLCVYARSRDYSEEHFTFLLAIFSSQEMVGVRFLWWCRRRARWAQWSEHNTIKRWCFCSSSFDFIWFESDVCVSNRRTDEELVKTNVDITKVSSCAAAFYFSVILL